MLVQMRSVKPMAGCIAMFAFGAALPASAVDASAPAQFTNDIRPVLMKYCGDCHKKEKNGAFLSAVELSQIGSKPSPGHSVTPQLRTRTTPPADEEQPGEPDRI